MPRGGPGWRRVGAALGVSLSSTRRFDAQRGKGVSSGELHLHRSDDGLFCFLSGALTAGRSVAEGRASEIVKRGGDPDRGQRLQPDGHLTVDPAAGSLGTGICIAEPNHSDGSAPLQGRRTGKDAEPHGIVRRMTTCHVLCVGVPFFAGSLRGSARSLSAAQHTHHPSSSMSSPSYLPLSASSSSSSSRSSPPPRLPSRSSCLSGPPSKKLKRIALSSFALLLVIVCVVVYIVRTIRAVSFWVRPRSHLFLTFPVLAVATAATPPSDHWFG